MDLESTDRRNPNRNLALACAALATALAVPAAAQLDPSRVGWSKVTLHGSKLTVKLRSEIELKSAPAAAELLAARGRRPHQPRAAESWLMTIRTRVLGQDSRVRFWFEPRDALALQRSELSIAKKRRRHRTYRYAPGGVLVRTEKPAEGEADAPRERWSDIEEGFVEHPGELADGLIITEPSALFYVVSASDLTAGTTSQVHVFSKGQVSSVAIEVQGREQIEVDYAEKSPRGERRVQGSVEAVRVALRPRPPAGESKSRFKLLGLEGDVDLHLGPANRVVLQVAGRVRLAGSVRLRLRQAVLR